MTKQKKKKLAESTKLSIQSARYTKLSEFKVIKLTETKQVSLTESSGSI